MAQYVILQSGYLSYPMPDLVRSYPTQDKTALQLMNLAKADRRINNPFYYHREADTAFKAFEDSPVLLKDFDFRQRVLTIAKQTFGQHSFYDWVCLQKNSPYLTTMHRRFIYDTLGYLINGHRSVCVESWMNLIEARDITDVDARVAYNPADFFALKYGSGNAVSDTCPQSLPPELMRLIQQWVSQPDGFKDLLYSLYIIAGKQTEYTPV